ncbi:MAG: hypothetical protein GXP04_05045 [Alphaproteobacteria bacterium]|nr:hypothetical protein [Alphaproteobacteria bacterium]
MGNLVQVAQYFDPEEAYCAKGYLQSYGIDTIIQNEHHLTMAPWLRVALGGYRLLVFSDLEEDARQALKSVSTSDGFEKLEQLSSEGEAFGPPKRRIRNWFWLPIAFLSSVPFIPLYRSNMGLLMQSCVLVLLYATFIGLRFWQFS